MNDWIITALILIVIFGVFWFMMENVKENVAPTPEDYAFCESYGGKITQSAMNFDIAACEFEVCVENDIGFKTCETEYYYIKDMRDVND